MLTPTVDFAPVHEAQLGPADLAKLCAVSRVTASLWLNNHTQPHHLLTERVTKIVDGIKAAVDAGLLPVPHHVTRRERGLYVKTAIERATTATA